MTSPSETAPAAVHGLDFGLNQRVVDEQRQRYLHDPDSVDQTWRVFFAAPPAAAVPEGRDLPPGCTVHPRVLRSRCCGRRRRPPPRSRSSLRAASARCCRTTRWTPPGSCAYCCARARSARISWRRPPGDRLHRFGGFRRRHLAEPGAPGGAALVRKPCARAAHRPGAAVRRRAAGSASRPPPRRRPAARTGRRRSRRTAPSRSARRWRWCR
ncbi:MAG: hypothetical protein JF597_26130 [Streptomyces sp.]|nr:hypothetical protein [Streptomyces sp.]